MNSPRDVIESVEAFPLAIPRDTPYLGPLDGITPDPHGHFVRPGNPAVYSVSDHSLLIRVVTESGLVGWGEAMSLIVPQVPATIVRDLVGPLVRGRHPHDVVAIHEDLYDAMRLRGHFGGFYLEALAALDIALWDLRGKLLRLPLSALLGGQRREHVPIYLSGLAGRDRAARAQAARDWVVQGFAAVKFAATAASEGEVAEMQAIRDAVGPRPDILVDLYWRYTAPEAIALISRLEPYRLFAAEAPVSPEDVAGLAEVARAVKTPLAAGEELRTVYEFLPRFTQGGLGIIQPEVGRMGVTEFWQVCQMARAFHLRVMPHAGIGIGVALAASVQVAATLLPLISHEYQPGVFERNLGFVTGGLRRAGASLTVPDGSGLGVEPSADVLSFAVH